jgi:hypothetical protein
MNVEIGAEAAQFPEKEYINGIAFAVWVKPMGQMSSQSGVQWDVDLIQTSLKLLFTPQQ